MPYGAEFFQPLERVYTLELLQGFDPKFKPENYDRIPPLEESITPTYNEIGELIQDRGVRDRYARQFIREALEKRHGRKVISLHQYVNLRGLQPQAEFDGLNALEVYESVQRGETIVL